MDKLRRLEAELDATAETNLKASKARIDDFYGATLTWDELTAQVGLAPDLERARETKNGYDALRIASNRLADWFSDPARPIFDHRPLAERKAVFQIVTAASSATTVAEFVEAHDTFPLQPPSK